MVYPGRAIVRPFPDLVDFVAFVHPKWALVVNKIYRIRSEVSVPPNISIFFSVNIVGIFDTTDGRKIPLCEPAVSSTELWRDLVNARELKARKARIFPDKFFAYNESESFRAVTLFCLVFVGPFSVVRRTAKSMAVSFRAFRTLRKKAGKCEMK